MEIVHGSHFDSPLHVWVLLSQPPGAAVSTSSLCNLLFLEQIAARLMLKADCHPP
jgi:hypothetical protein